MTRNNRNDDVTNKSHQLFMVKNEIEKQEIALNAIQGTTEAIKQRIADLHHIANGFEAELIELEAQS